MEHIKQFVYDFVEGRVSVQEFLKECDSHPEILDWIQSIVSPNLKGANLIEDNTIKGELRLVPASYNIRTILKIFKREYKETNGLSYRYAVFGEIAKILHFAFPDSPPHEDTTLSNLYNYIIDCCPSYVGGMEVEQSGILEEIVNDMPKNLTKTAGKKWVNNKIKERFHVVGRHYPYWIQGPEWPMMDGEPMEYVRTERHGIEGQTHYFRNPHTGIERTIEDWY